jgi:5-methylcytosine-specific restriction protein A
MMAGRQNRPKQDDENSDQVPPAIWRETSDKNESGEVMSMPTKPKVPCKHPGCATLIPSGTKYCDRHKPLHPEDIRSPAKLGYGSAWQKARKRFLFSHPLCVECLKEGRYVKATDVDHIIPHRGDQALFWDESNWQALCHRCHSRKTRRQDQTPTYHY